MSCPFSGAVRSQKSGGCPFGFASEKSGNAEDSEQGFGCCTVIKTGGLDLTAIIEGQDNVVEMKNVPGFLAIEDLVQLLLTSSSVTAIPKNTPVNDVTITKVGNDYPFPQSAKLSNLDLHSCDKIILRPVQKPDTVITVKVASASSSDVVELNGLPSSTPLSRLADILLLSHSLSPPSPSPPSVRFHTTEGVPLPDQSMTLRSAGILDGDWLLASFADDASSPPTLPRIKKLDVTKMAVPTATPRDLDSDSDSDPDPPVPAGESHTSSPTSSRAFAGESTTIQGSHTPSTASRCPYTRACALAKAYVLPYKVHLAVLLLALLWISPLSSLAAN